VQAFAELGQRRTLRDLSKFPEQIVGKRHASGRGPDFQTAVKNLWNISNLYHSTHVPSIFACDAHVNAKE
jgi:hypothetical protein